MHNTHHPRIIELGDGKWQIECLGCRSDRSSDVPIGIGIPLQDRLTAERLAENHYRDWERESRVSRSGQSTSSSYPDVRSASSPAPPRVSLSER